MGVIVPLLQTAFNAWRIRKESRGVAISQRELLQIRQYQQSVVANRAQSLERIKDKRINDPRLNGDSNSSLASNNDQSLTAESAFRMLDLAEPRLNHI